jgi:DNA-binding XRE family transcriptional regulator
MSPAQKLAEELKVKPINDVSSPTRPLRCIMTEHRQALGLTLINVGSFIGLSASQLCHIEAGADTKLTVGLKLANFYGLSVEAIWSIQQEANRDNPCR